MVSPLDSKTSFPSPALLTTISSGLHKTHVSDDKIIHLIYPTSTVCTTLCYLSLVLNPVSESMTLGDIVTSPLN